MSSRRRAQTDLSSGPSRHDSTSTNSSRYSVYSNTHIPSRTSTVSSNSSSGNSPDPHERKEYSSRIRNSIQMFDGQSSPGETYGNIRRSLRPLPQAPNSTPPRPKTSSYHTRSRTLDSPIPQEEYTLKAEPKPSPSQYDRASSMSPEPSQLANDQQLTPRRRAHHSRTQSSPHPPPLTTAFTAPEIQTFQKSSTRHLRTLSKFVENESEDFAIANVASSVVGLHGRRQLKRADTIRPQRPGVGIQRPKGSAWTESTWMDKQRQFIQAYEYLCHIGEAKEWIEDVIHKPIPPIVQLEEALRDGVTLAEVVQALYPHRVLRIFRHPRLQYRHSDNIALFFQFLDEIELPEVFRFELIDLYEKKNIPKVIHCIHALSWLLFKKNIVDFRIGNLVGQLEFEHHELEQTQRGLDRSGVPMPSFSGMGESFGAEPEPEPEPEPAETEEQRIDRLLRENEAAIEDFQSQVRGAILRLKLGDVMQHLWDNEEWLIDLQSRIRGDWARQIFDYRLGMQRFAVDLQSFSRGFLARVQYRNHYQQQQVAEPAMLLFQSLVRGRKARAKMQFLKSRARKEESGIKSFQAAIRGALARKQVFADYDGVKNTETDVEQLQATIMGMLQRRAFSQILRDLNCQISPIVDLQAAVRGMWQREKFSQEMKALDGKADGITALQAAIRGMWQRQFFDHDLQALRAEEGVVAALQASIKGMWQRQAFSRDLQCLHAEKDSITDLQSSIRGAATRKMLQVQRKTLEQHNVTWVSIQSYVRGAAARKSVDTILTELEDHVESVVDSQSAIRGMLLRKVLNDTKLDLQDNEEEILELQSLVRGFLLRQRLKKDHDALVKELPRIVSLQALARAAMVRIPIGELLSQLEACEAEVVELQALSRAMLVRLDVGTLLSDLEAEEETVVEVQALVRGYVVRQHFAEKLRFYRENMDKVIKVQSFVRAKIQGEAYKSLTSGKNPPVGTIKGFVHLLNDSDFDFDEEIEFERMRKTVVQQVRQNEMADQYISQLDIKIALLVKNKITLDEVVKHQKHFGGHVGSLLPNRDMSSKDPFDLKALNKTSRRKLEHYQELFFLLQTQPQYLARIFKRMREQVTSEREYERVKHLVMGLFGYSQKRREEYYLLKLIVKSIKEEVDAAPSVHDYIRGNYLWNKLFTAYVKSPRDRRYMRDSLGPVVKENIIENPDLDLESDPMQIYRSTINNEELRTGRRSRRRPDVPREEAIRDPETRETFIRHLQDLRDVADQIFSALEETLYRMPFGVRFITKQIYEYLLSKFQDDDKGYILQVAGQWVWKNYLQPALMEPEKFGVVDRALTQEQRRNMGEVSKVIAQAASGRLFGNENVYLQPLNTYIGESIQRLGQIWANMITVQDAEAYFEIDEFNDLYAKTKPTLYIKMSDIFSIHQLVAAEIQHISIGHDDTLKEIIRDLGSVKSNENELMNVSTSEINLTLTPKLHNAEDPDAEVKALFMETKRCILYIIRVQSGANLMEILVTPPTEEDDQRWHTLVRDELSHNSRKHAAYSDANTLTDIGAMSYQELKRTALENIVLLEQAGRITRKNNYQDILNEIAIDIRTKHRRRIQRQRELENIRLTLDRLHDQAVYLDQQLKTYNDYIEQAMITLQNKKGKKRFLMPFTKQWDHQRELQRTGRHFKFGSYKYSARNLADKGVLVHWKGYTERQWDRVDLTISSNEVGVFMIDGSSGNMMVPGANAQVPLDDLLQAQFNNTQFMDLFEGQLRVNVNLFLHLIMRKFYNE